MEPIIQSLLAILNEWLANARENLPQIAAAVLVLALAMVAARLAARVLSRTLRSRRTDPEFAMLLARLLRWGIIGAGAVLALEQAGTDVTALLTGLGILGFTVGFALQDVSKNFIAGLLILLNQPFDLGDTIEVGEYTGRVQDINLRDLVMQTVDGRYVRIPNADVITQSLVNYTRTRRRRIELRIRVANDTDLAKASAEALAAVRQTAGLLDDPDPEVVFDSFGDWAIQGGVYYWVDLTRTSYWTAQTSGVQAIQAAFAKAGIEMPYPAHPIPPGATPGRTDL